MRTYTTEHTVYKFEELSEEAQQNALEKLYDINVDWSWWEYIYDDAKDIGLEITSFDLYHNDIEGRLTEDLPTVAQRILDNHGDVCETYQLAKQWQHKHGEDNETEFLKLLLGEYKSLLEREYEYQTSEEAIKETIDANEYEFTKEGILA